MRKKLRISSKNHEYITLSINNLRKNITNFVKKSQERVVNFIKLRKDIANFADRLRKTYCRFCRLVTQNLLLILPFSCAKLFRFLTIGRDKLPQIWINDRIKKNDFVNSLQKKMNFIKISQKENANFTERLRKENTNFLKR